MKKLVLTLIAVVTLSAMASAQYNINKTKYNFRAYTYEAGDPFNPTLCGVMSFMIPGVGQMIAQEGSRGAAFLVVDIASTIIYFVGTVQIADDPEGLNGAGAVLFGAAGIITTTIWSTVDAVRVAKVNNLAWRDKNNTGLNLQLNPFIIPVQTYNSTKTQIGLRFTMSF